MLIGTSRDQTKHISLSSHRMHLHDFVDFAERFNNRIDLTFFDLDSDVGPYVIPESLKIQIGGEAPYHPRRNKPVAP